MHQVENLEVHTNNRCICDLQKKTTKQIVSVHIPFRLACIPSCLETLRL